MQFLEQQIILTEDKITKPLTSVLNNKGKDSLEAKESLSPIRESLDILFPEQQFDDKSIQKAKEILGKTALEYSKEQLEEIIAEIKFLVTSWIDEYERSIFGNKTLNEFLHERSGP
jgi:acyl carrier protein